MLLDRLALGALLLPLVCAEAVPTLTLHDQVVLTGARYRLVDVGMLACNEQPDCVALGALFLGTAPRPGTTARVSKVQLQAQLRQLGLPAAGRLAWAGADSVAITASAQSVPAEQLASTARAALIQALGADGLEIMAAAPTAPLLVPDGVVSLRARPVLLAPRSAMKVDVDVSIDGRFYRAVTVPLTIALRRPVLVARHGLSAGARLDCADFVAEERDVAKLATPAQAADCQRSMRLRHSLQQGEVLDLARLAPMPAVRQGDRVTVSVQQGGIVIETFAVALADGEIGKTIQIRPGHASAAIPARVIAAGKLTLMETP